MDLRVSTRGEYLSNNFILHEVIDVALQRDAANVNGILLYYQNVRGLRTKIDEFFLNTRDSDLDVIVLTETGLDNRINSLQLFGTAFNVFRCDRSARNSNKSNFGGVLVAIAQCHPSSAIETVNGNCLEQVCVSATIRGKKLFLCGIYIPPDKSQNTDVIEAHISCVGELSDKSADNDVILICGDYNQPRIEWASDSTVISTHLAAAGTTLIDGMNYYNLNQMNYQKNRLGRTLDLVFCPSECQCLVETCIAPLLPVDHHHPPLAITLFTAGSSSTARVFAENETRSLNYRRIDFAALTEYLSNVDWQTVYECADVNDMTGCFCNIIVQWLHSNLPFVKRPISPAWSTPRLRELKRLRNTAQRKHRLLKTALARCNFKRCSDQYRRLNMTLYKSYVLRVQTDLRKNPRNFWNYVNSKRKCASVPLHVQLDSIETTSERESCELFAKFFASVFADQTATDVEAQTAAETVPIGLADLSCFEISTDLILAAAKKLKRSYSAGPDGIPAIVFNRCADVLTNPLRCIFNKSFEQSKFPEIWKQSHMFPVLKSGDRQNVRNYRGITSLSAGSKLFEIVVSGYVLTHTKNYISTAQHGFMPGRSVCTNLLEFTSSCFSRMEQKMQVDAVYTDLKAAFDRIDHGILLRKISRLGASCQFVDWLSSYLRGRILRVKLGSSISSQFTNNSGVPQGSNMGPLLFMLFFNDVTLLLGVGCKLVYADDLKLFLVVQTIEDCHRLQSMLNIFVDWCRKNWLVISIAKCEVITFHRIQNPIIFDYRINGLELKRVDRVNDLGILLDARLTFHLHHTTIISKATRQLGFISKIARDLKDPHCMKALYCSLVRPLLENCSLVWFPHQLTWNLRIERVQKRFIRFALRELPWRDPVNLPPYPDRCRLLGIDTLERRRKIQQAAFIAKVANGELDSPNLLSLLNFRASQRTLRSTGMLQTSFHRTSFGYNEPITSCIRTFASVEELFEFDESSRIFVKKITRANIL